MTTPMTPLQPAANPFLLMMDPGAVFAAMARSDRLDRLTSRVCRPLDKPAAVRASADDAVDEEALDRVTDSVPVPVPASASA